MPERNNRFNTPDFAESRLMKYLVRIVVVIVIGALGVFLYTNMHEHKETDTERGVARLQELESIDVAETEKMIRGLRDQSTGEEISSNEELTLSLKGEYLDAAILVLGDSAAQLLLDYDILDDSCVMATIGGGAATSGSIVNTAIALAPERIVLDYGLDDLVYFSGNADEFSAAYEALVQTVREGLPRTEIYLCEITPVASDALDMQPEYSNVDSFNTAIKRLARTMNVNYLETHDLIDEYATDGVHPSYSYYVSYAERVLRAAQNKQEKSGQSEDGLHAGDGND